MIRKSAGKIFFIFFLLASVPLCVSCINPDSLVPMTKDQILAYMNENFEGDFVYNSKSSDNYEDSTGTQISMTCTLADGTVFDNVITSHEFNANYFGMYFDKEGSLITNYYSYVYGDQLDEYYSNKVEEAFKNLKDTLEFKLLNISHTKEHVFTNARKQINSFEEYLDSKNFKEKFALVFFCEKTDDYQSSEPWLSIRVIEYDITHSQDYSWLYYINVFYAADYKNQQDKITEDLVTSDEWGKKYFILKI